MKPKCSIPIPSATAALLLMLTYHSCSLVHGFATSSIYTPIPQSLTATRNTRNSLNSLHHCTDVSIFMPRTTKKTPKRPMHPRESIRTQMFLDNHSIETSSSGGSGGSTRMASKPITAPFPPSLPRHSVEDIQKVPILSTDGPETSVGPGDLGVLGDLGDVIVHKQEEKRNESHEMEQMEPVPTTWGQALHQFFLGSNPGPSLALGSIVGFATARVFLANHHPISLADASLFLTFLLLWWIQEYLFHRFLLHSPFSWMGKSIHRTHHEKPYFHVSIDPPELVLTWLFVSHLIWKSIFPWHLCLSATVGYSLAGLVYEWSHYIVHTKVKPLKVGKVAGSSSPALPASPLSRLGTSIALWMSSLFSQMRDNHIRHHLVDDGNWYAFSVPAMDDVFGTNPDVRELKQLNRLKQLKQPKQLEQQPQPQKMTN